jgi:hypothetical protein
MEIITKKCKFTLNQKSYKMDIILLYPYQKLENIKGVARVKNIQYDKNYYEHDVPEEYQRLSAIITLIINDSIKLHTGYDKNFIGIAPGDNQFCDDMFYLSYSVSNEINGRRILDYEMTNSDHYELLKKMIKQCSENK